MTSIIDPDLVAAAAGGDPAARGRLVTAMRGDVARIARRVADRYDGRVHADDLMTPGMLAVLDAASRYRADGARFGAFAEQRVRGAMLDAIREEHVPRSTERAARAWAAAEERAAERGESMRDALAAVVGHSVRVDAYRAQAARFRVERYSKLDDADGGRFPATSRSDVDAIDAADAWRVFLRALRARGSAAVARYLEARHAGASLREVAADAGLTANAVSAALCGAREDIAVAARIAGLVP